MFDVNLNHFAIELLKKVYLKWLAMAAATGMRCYGVLRHRNILNFGEAKVTITAGGEAAGRRTEMLENFKIWGLLMPRQAAIRSTSNFGMTMVPVLLHLVH